MIIGAHSIIYSKSPGADRAFLRDVLGLPSVDAGEGWLIFGLPPAEVAIHPSNKNNLHEFYLMTDDIDAFIAQKKKEPHCLRDSAESGMGIADPAYAPGRRKARRL